jgi:hypothetical protein
MVQSSPSEIRPLPKDHFVHAGRFSGKRKPVSIIDQHDTYKFNPDNYLVE